MYKRSTKPIYCIRKQHPCLTTVANKRNGEMWLREQTGLSDTSYDKKPPLFDDFTHQEDKQTLIESAEDSI